MSTFRALSSIHQQLLSSFARTECPGPTPGPTHPSSLDIPEILEHILNHVDDKSTRLSVVRVCRSWYILQQHRIVREVLWHSNPTPNQRQTISEEQVLRATHLYCYFQQDGQHFSAETNWLINCLRAKAAKAKAPQNHAKDLVAEGGSGRDERSKTSEDRGQQSIFDAQSLRGLTLQGYVNLSLGLPLFLLYLSSIASLTVQQQGNCELAMAQLFEACPQLVALHLESAGTIVLSEPWLAGSTPTNSSNKSTDSGTTTSSSLRLQSLTLINVQLSKHAWRP